MACSCTREALCSWKDEEFRALLAGGFLREIITCRIETTHIPVLGLFFKNCSAMGRNMRKAARHAFRHRAVHMRYGEELYRTWSETGTLLTIGFIVHYYGYPE